MGRTGLTGVGYGWSLLSILAAALVSGGYYVPVWLVGELELEDQRMEAYFGSFRRCNYPWTHPDTRRVELVRMCGRYKTFQDIPSIWWQVSTVTVGLGSALALLVGLVSLPACCVSDVVSRTSGRLLGLFQVTAAILVLVGCVLYPLGWANKEVADACGYRSGAYLLGGCTLGWAFYVVLGGASLLLVCGSLSAHAGQPVRWQRLQDKPPSPTDQPL